MKRLVLTALALGLLSTAADAQSSLPRSTISGNQFCTYGNSGAQWCVPRASRATGKPCVLAATLKYSRAGDQRYWRLRRETARRGGTAQAALTLQNTRDWQSLRHDVMRACSARATARLDQGRDSSPGRGLSFMLRPNP
jgi:hypothetical protein